MSREIPEIVLKLKQLCKPTFVNGKWRKSAISPRRLAGVRKAMVASGTYWPPKPLRDRSGDKPFKLIKHERTRGEREKKIEDNMAKMPKMIEEHHAKMRDMRKAKREKKVEDEAKRYSIATGKISDLPEWVKQAQELKKKKALKPK